MRLRGLFFIGLLAFTVVGASSQQPVNSTLQLQRLLVSQDNVQSAFSSSWRLVAKTEVTDPPPNSLSAALIYGNTDSSLLASLFQFETDRQAQDFMSEDIVDVLNAKEILSHVEADRIEQALRVGDERGAASAELARVLMGVRSDPDEDEQQLIIRFRAGQFVASLALRLCIPPHPDPQTGEAVPYQCFDEAAFTDSLIELGQTQLDLLFREDE